MENYSREDLLDDASKLSRKELRKIGQKILELERLVGMKMGGREIISIIVYFGYSYIDMVIIDDKGETHGLYDINELLIKNK